jgi:hypothetical protein
MSDIEKIAEVTKRSATRPPARTKPPEGAGPHTICPNPNCGYRGQVWQSSKISTGELIAGIILAAVLLPTVIGTVLLLVWLVSKSGYKYTCPRCGNRINL